MVDKRLRREIQLLYAVEAKYKIAAAPVINQLLADTERPLPDTLPHPPAWAGFTWPMSGEVNFTQYWKNHDWMNRA